jgi:hypothetical protein
MRRVWFLVALLVAIGACAPGLPALPFTGRDPARDVSTWPAADTALATASSTMSQLKTLREHVVTRTFRNGELFLSLDSDRAYVAPDRKYERMEGRSAVEAVEGETVQIGAQFFKRVGKEGQWQQFPWTESVVWPGQEYSFGGAKNVTYAGPGEVDGRLARILVIQHEGSAETRNAGWQFQTRLWIDPTTNYFLRRETTGAREEPDPTAGKPMLSTYEGTWTYMSHNGSIAISAPVEPN